jgi:hypothetical protein
LITTARVRVVVPDAHLIGVELVQVAGGTSVYRLLGDIAYGVGVVVNDVVAENQMELWKEAGELQ